MFEKLRNLDSNFTIHKATLLIGGLTLVSRLTGLFRETLFARQFGAGDTLDIYFTAFRIPDTVFNLLILGTLSVSFIPIFSEYIIKDKEQAKRLASTALNISTSGMAVICLILLIFADPLVKLIAPGFSGEKLEQTVMLTRLMLASPLIFTVSNVLTSILTTYKKFFIINIAPIFYNLGIIGGLLILYPRWGLMGLGAGVLAGALMHLLIQVPEVLRNGFSWQPVLAWADPGVKKVVKLFVPRIFGLDISYGSLLIATIIGSVLPAGSITVFNFANNLQAMPLGLFAFSAAIAAFPVLSEKFSRRDEPGFLKNLQQTIVQTLFYIIPISILMLILRAYIVRLVYGYGQCDWQCTIRTFDTLGVFTFALFSQALVPILARAFYARHNTKIPVIIGLVSLGINAIAAYILAPYLGVVGIAAGFVCASVFNALVLFIVLRAHLSRHAESARPALIEFDKTIARALQKIVFSSVLMGTITYGFVYLMANVVNTQTIIGVLLQTAVSGIVGVASYLVIGYYMKLYEARNLINSFWQRLGRWITNPFNSRFFG